MQSCKESDLQNDIPKNQHCPQYLVCNLIPLFFCSAEKVQNNTHVEQINRQLPTVHLALADS